MLLCPTTLLCILSTATLSTSTPIRRIPKRSDKIPFNESSLTDFFKTERLFRINDFANRKFQERLTQSFDDSYIIRRKPNIIQNLESTTVAAKLNRKSRHKIQSSGKSFKKFTGIYIPIAATKKLIDSLLLTSPKPETTRDEFMEFYYWADFGKNKVHEFKKVRNRKVSESPQLVQQPPLSLVAGSNLYTNHTGWENKSSKKAAALPPYYGFRLGFVKPSLSQLNKKNKKSSATYFMNPNSTVINGITISINDSSVSDKIKFFETYDNGAKNDYNLIKNLPVISEEPFLEHDSGLGNKAILPVTKKNVNNSTTESSNNQQTLDFDVDISVYDDDNKTKFAIKEIIPNIKTSSTPAIKYNKLTLRTTSIPTKNIGKPKTFHPALNKKHPNGTIYFSREKSNYSKEVLCSKYPFVAAYVYEPLQVFCDAASVSRYWLITAATCLTHKDYSMKSLQLVEERSAFVSYCSEKWWDPHSITYVKKTKIHPQFDKQARSSQYLYNIGLILVVNAMSSSCVFWSPVSMLSRRLITKQEGHKAFAVGWGLDRYDTKSSVEVPKHHLSLYKGTVFSNACPGNFGYSKIKNVLEPEILENIYCLSLPPYFGESSDPLHGSLLMESGQLIGLYLKEERRSFGPQAAQYIGVWKHVPWIMDNSKDPEDTDNIQIDII